MEEFRADGLLTIALKEIKGKMKSMRDGFLQNVTNVAHT